MLHEWVYHILFTLSRWLHLSAMALIVGGTLFYELVVPIAIEDLKNEQQLYIFARARWTFRWVVWIGAALLLVTGLIELYQMWRSYVVDYPATRPWATAHVALAAVALGTAVTLTLGRRPLNQPVRWMRLNLVILFVVISLGVLTRHVRLTIREEYTRDVPMDVRILPARTPATSTAPIQPAP